MKVPSPSLSFLLTVVYAPPHFIKCKPFWDYLQNLAMSISLLWILLGDFNDMIYEEEKLGGLLVNRTLIAAFRNCLDKCGLIDLGFHSPRFTWTNKSPTWQSTIKERLDRGLGNVDWTCFSLSLKFTTSLGSSLITALLCLTLTFRSPNPLNPSLWANVADRPHFPIHSAR